MFCELPILACIPLAITELVFGTAWSSDDLVDSWLLRFDQDVSCSTEYTVLLSMKSMFGWRLIILCYWNIFANCFSTSVREVFNQQVQRFRFVVILCKYHAGSAYCHSQFWMELYNINGTMQHLGGCGGWTFQPPGPDCFEAIHFRKQLEMKHATYWFKRSVIQFLMLCILKLRQRQCFNWEHIRSPEACLKRPCSWTRPSAPAPEVLVGSKGVADDACEWFLENFEDSHWFPPLQELQSYTSYSTVIPSYPFHNFTEARAGEMP